MKRLIFVASLAILAAACQKTEIQNEVQTPISFSTETGKMTRAIVDDKFDTSQPFGVYSYGWNDAATDVPNTDPVMNNVKIVSTQKDDETYTWKSASGAYYWPNDPTTYLNFYAYSPYVDESTVDDTKLNGTVSHFERSDAQGNTNKQIGFKLADYVHKNMYVDFMVATPVNNSTYAFPDGTEEDSQPAGTVPMTFNHQMTQVVFVVTTDKPYDGITFTVEEIKLKKIESKATYTNETLVPGANFAHGTWIYTDDTSVKSEYTIFPALKNNYAPITEDQTEEELLSVDGEDDNSTIDEAEKASMTTIPVTMIPQTMADAGTTEVAAGTDSYAGQDDAQMFMIKYSISGDGVAEETVVKHVPFKATETATAFNWLPNMKITYTVKIGLNEIYFEPSVANWDTKDASGKDYADDYYVPENIE